MFLADNGAIALQLVRAHLTQLHKRGEIDLHDLEGILRSQTKDLPIDQSADLDGAIEIVTAIRDSQ